MMECQCECECVQDVNVEDGLCWDCSQHDHAEGFDCETGHE